MKREICVRSVMLDRYKPSAHGGRSGPDWLYAECMVAFLTVTFPKRILRLLNMDFLPRQL